MPFTRKRRTDEDAGTRLIEIVTPRTNAATITPAENLLAAISLPEPFCLEIAATHDARWFLARAGTPAMRAHLAELLGVAYPQAEFRSLDPAQDPTVDPTFTRPGEQVRACALVLRGPAYLPIRTFRDQEVAADRSAQADPVLGLVRALGELPAGWRGLSQLVLRPAPENWCRPYLRLAVEHPLAHERTAAGADTSLTSVFLMAGLVVASVGAFQAYLWYEAGEWVQLGLLAGGVGLGLPFAYRLVRRLTKKAIYDPRLVAEKVSRLAYLAQVRIAVFAPADSPPEELTARLERIATAYRQFDLAAGNGLVPRRLRLGGHHLGTLDALPTGRPIPVLNSRELAGLWHLPQAQSDLPLLERTTARRRLPVPRTVARGCRIGVSVHQGREVPVALPDDLLRRHLLLVAKTRRGKSSLLLRIAEYLMTPRESRACRPPAGSGPSDPTAPGLLLVDPHRDLAEAALGIVPRERHDDVVYLNVADQTRPFGLNLLDTGLGWDRDKAVSNALDIFKREFDRFWGPRMEDAFRHALLTLYEANQAICAVDPAGRSRQHTVLQVPTVLADPAFRRGVLPLVADPLITSWWANYFDRMERRQQIEVINPVQTKVQRFAGSHAAWLIVGQPRSTINPRSWPRDGAIVIVNTAKGVVGESTAALIGATLINLMDLVVGEQAALPVPERRPVTLLIDEFQLTPGANYEGILSELAKYGANLILATQSLARLEALDRERERALRATVFANLDGLFAFQTSAEDARYLVPELGEGIDEHDLVALGDYHCYAKLSAGGERLPVFSVRLDPPPAARPATHHLLAAVSAGLYGRHCQAVENDVRSALARVELARRAVSEPVQAGEPGAGVNRDAAVASRPQNPTATPERSQNRTSARRPTDPHQASLFPAGDAAVNASDAPRTGPAAEAAELADQGEDA